MTFHRFENGSVQQFKDFMKRNDVLNRQLILWNRPLIAIINYHIINRIVQYCRNIKFMKLWIIK